VSQSIKDREATVMRMVGNLLSNTPFNPDVDEEKLVARAVQRARAIVREVERTKPVETEPHTCHDMFPPMAGLCAACEREKNEVVPATCLDCGLPYTEFPLDLVMSRPQWLEINPDDGGVICAACMIERASKVPGCTVVHATMEISVRRVETVEKGFSLG
jgi:hypothetical protein